MNDHQLSLIQPGLTVRHVEFLRSAYGKRIQVKECSQSLADDLVGWRLLKVNRSGLATCSDYGEAVVRAVSGPGIPWASLTVYNDTNIVYHESRKEALGFLFLGAIQPGDIEVWGGKRGDDDITFRVIDPGLVDWSGFPAHEMSKGSDS